MISQLIIIFICALGVGIGAMAAWFTFKRTTPPKGDVKDSERQDALERLKIWSEFWKYFLVSFALVLITTLLSNALKERELKTQESKQAADLVLETAKAKVSNVVAENENLGKFLERALSEDWRKQYAFASYFSHLTGDTDSQKRWEAYATFIVLNRTETAILEEEYNNMSRKITAIRDKNPLDPQLPEMEKQLSKWRSQLELNQAVLPGRFKATKQQVDKVGIPPDSFLDELIAWGRAAPDEIFAADDPENAKDVYASLEKQLGPWQGPLHRRAAMLEVMRVLAGFESSWNWNEGVIDLNNSNSDAGAWQVTAQSMNFGPELKSLVSTRVGTVDPVAFQRATKTDHPFAMEYVARVLRRTIGHFGPLSRHQVDAWLRRDAVDEFQALIGDDARKRVPGESKP